MSQRCINVFLVERNITMSAIVGDYINLQTNMCLCGRASECDRALTLLQECDTDVVLLNLEMPYWDELEFLNALDRLNLKKVPRVLALCEVTYLQLVQKAMPLNVENILPKPYPLDQLVAQIKFLMQDNSLRNKKIAAIQLITDLNGAHCLSGYNYLTQALLMLVDREQNPSRMDKLYEKLAEKNNITYSAIECAMRKAVNYIFSNNNNVLQKVLKATNRETTTHMSNIEFLFLLEAYLNYQDFGIDRKEGVR